MSSLEELFCNVDDFCQIFEPLWYQELIPSGKVTRLCLRGISPEIHKWAEGSASLTQAIAALAGWLALAVMAIAAAKRTEFRQVLEDWRSPYVFSSIPARRAA